VRVRAVWSAQAGACSGEDAYGEEEGGGETRGESESRVRAPLVFGGGSLVAC
jgi:hypothetical protein